MGPQIPVHSVSFWLGSHVFKVWCWYLHQSLWSAPSDSTCDGGYRRKSEHEDVKSSLAQPSIREVFFFQPRMKISWLTFAQPSAGVLRLRVATNPTIAKERCCCAMKAWPSSVAKVKFPCKQGRRTAECNAPGLRVCKIPGTASVMIPFSKQNLEPARDEPLLQKMMFWILHSLSMVPRSVGKFLPTRNEVVWYNTPHYKSMWRKILAIRETLSEFSAISA